MQDKYVVKKYEAHNTTVEEDKQIVRMLERRTTNPMRVCPDISGGLEMLIHVNVYMMVFDNTEVRGLFIIRKNEQRLAIIDLADITIDTTKTMDRLLVVDFVKEVIKLYSEEMKLTDVMLATKFNTEDVLLSDVYQVLGFKTESLVLATKRVDVSDI